MNVDWLLTTRGRLARIAAGTLLILLGLGVIGGFIGVLFLILGAIPIASAAYGALLIGPLFGRDMMGRRPEDQPEDEKKDSQDEEDEDEDEDSSADSSADEDSEDDSSADDAPEADPDWSAPPLARAERPEGQEPRTRDLRTDED